MALKVCLDAGHYGKYNRSSVYPSYYESDMTWKLHLLLKKELEKLGVKVITTRDNKDIDLDLHIRGAKSQGCALFISLHSNACNTESVDRVVVIPYQDISWTDIDDKSRELSEKLGACVTDVMGVSSYQIYPRKASNDRDGNGKLDDEYYGVLYGARKVGTVGLILEHGFHTNTNCAKWLSNDSNLEKLAKAEAKVILDYLKKYEVVEEEKTVYRVQVGAYNDKKEAEKKLKELKALNIEGFITTSKVKVETTPTPATPTLKDVDEIAWEVVKGMWGVGNDRVKRLSEAGYNPTQVQKRVNEILLKK